MNLFEIKTEAGVVCGRDLSCADAAQTAECLHARYKIVHLVVEVSTGEVMYESLGPVE